MPETYNTIQGDITVSAANTAARTGVSDSVAIVGGYDANNADSAVTAGEATLATDPTEAADTFGQSELARAIGLAAANDASTIYGVPVAETQNTETVTASSSFTLNYAPVFDPTVHPDHEIVVTDTISGTDLTVNIVYDGTPSQPAETDTAAVNPITAEVATDSSSDYEVSYVYGNYTPAIKAAVRRDVRTVIVCTEASSHKTTLQTELDEIAGDVDFKVGYVGARPEIDASQAGPYTPDVDNRRVVEVTPARVTGPDGEVRHCAGIGAKAAVQPVGPDGSMLFDDVSGVVSLNKEYRRGTVKEFGRVVAVARNGQIGRAETTSTTPQFEDIHAVEIVDRLVSLLAGDVEAYAGGPQDLGDLAAELETTCQDASTGTPPLLGFARERDVSPYDVGVQLGATNEEAVANVTIVPYPVAERVSLNLTVADGFVQFGGVTA